MSAAAPPPAPAPTSVEEAELGAQLQARWYWDPVQFAYDVFGAELYRAQRRICKSIVRCAQRLMRAAQTGVTTTGKMRCAVKSGQKTGKSFLAALLACWWWTTRPNGRVMLTAPTGNQVRGVLWMEVTLAHQKAKKHLLEKYGIQGGLGGHIYEVPDRGLQGDKPGNEIVGRATNKAENMQGKSGDEMFVIVDEASGVPQKVFESMEGNTQGGGIILLMGNPNQTSGELYDAFHSKERLYECYTLSSEDTPNFRTGTVVIKGLALRQTVLNNRIAWGGEDGYSDDPRYQVRVLGEFPRQASSAVIPISVVERAHQAWYRFAASVLGREQLAESAAHWGKIIRSPAERETVLAEWRNDPHRLVIGLDVARFGVDSTVMVPRRGYRIFRRTQLKKRDEEVVCAQVLALVETLRRGNERPVVQIDATGGFGVAVAALLRRSRKVIVVEINSSNAADDPKQYINARAEMAFQALDFLRSGGGFEPDSELDDELVATRYHFDTKNRLQIEDKDEIKKRIGRSPDSADAFDLATYRYRGMLLGSSDPSGGLSRLPDRTFPNSPRGS